MLTLSQLQSALPIVPAVLGMTSILLIGHATWRLRSIVNQKKSLHVQAKLGLIDDILVHVKDIGTMQRLGADAEKIQSARGQLDDLLRQYKSMQRVEQNEESRGKVRA